jgi:hypothetical protein
MSFTPLTSEDLVPLSLCDVQQPPKLIHVEQDLSVCKEVERYELYHAFKCMVKLRYGVSMCDQLLSLCECEHANTRES